MCVPKTVTSGEVARKIKQDYTHGRREPGMRGLDSIHGMLKQLMEGEQDINQLVQSIVKSIYTEFNLKEISIALKSPDGLFRYVAMYGLGDEIWAAHRRLSYAEEQLLDPAKYKWTDVSHHTKLFLADENAYTAEEASTRAEHLSMRSKRKVVEDSIEGDYLDVFLYGPKDERLGWIEIGGTWDGKFPDAQTIRSLEIVSSVLSLAIVSHNKKNA